ncbi:rep protein [Lamposivirus ageladense]|uniref:Rep protein n=1 Tax=Circoviridae sp. TaxID=1954248 RepID=A0ABY4CE34_9VIRU|nr:rep protein [Circoviridae sp.]
MGRRYCFTLNNPTEEEIARINALEVKYIVYGHETGDNGTPHLQGFVIFNHSLQFNTVKNKLGERVHVEATRGTTDQAANYCKKDGNYVERGEYSSAQGKRSDWDAYKEWVLDLGRVPSRAEIVTCHPSLYARYRKACLDYAEALVPPPVLVEGEPRLGWQLIVGNIVNTVPNERHIHFVVDPDGNSGKSWMCKWYLTKYPERTQVLKIGKRDDLSYCIDIDKDIFLFDIPRGQMTYLQYSVLESLKDRMIFSPKYESAFKILRNVPHVIVFSNEQPDMNALSRDRYKIINVNNDN